MTRTSGYRTERHFVLHGWVGSEFDHVAVGVGYVGEGHTGPVFALLGHGLRPIRYLLSRESFRRDHHE
jgi:hypothetical protein